MATQSGNCIILGLELAQAQLAEGRRLAARPAGRSPLAGMGYRSRRGEFRLARPVRQPLDDAIHALALDFVREQHGVRDTIRSSITMDELYTVLEFARRAAVFSLREGEAAWARGGLAAIAMVEVERVDYRDLLVALGLLDHAARRIHLDVQRLMQRVIRLAENKTAELIAGYASASRRSPLRNMGFREIETDRGLGLAGDGLRRYRPRRNLAHVALQIAEVLEADKYRDCSITLGSDLPECWLELPGRPAPQALRRIRAGADVSAGLRPRECRRHAEQMCVAFLVELESAGAVRQLAQCASEPGRRSFASVSASCGELFCLLVARSSMVGVASFETQRSLARFGTVLQKVLEQY